MPTLGPSSASSTAPGGAQVSLDFSARPPPAPRRARPAGERAVDPRTKLALRLLLSARHEGMENAATWERLREELVAEGLQVGAVRRLQEAKDALQAEGVPVVATSGSGVFMARRAHEVALAIREVEKRARKSFMVRGRLRKTYREMLGQEAIRAVEDAG